MKNSSETCRRGNSSDFTVHIIKNTEELQQHIFEKKQIWDRKVKNREYSKGKFWVYYRELHANAKFKMADYSKNSLDLVRTNTHAQPWHCSFKSQ